jgi:hypothetical protein
VKPRKEEKQYITWRKAVQIPVLVHEAHMNSAVGGAVRDAQVAAVGPVEVFCVLEQLAVLMILFSLVVIVMHDITTR